MAREIDRLKAKTVAGKLAPGRHADGGGLYLVVDNAGARRWVFLYSLGGRRREMGLGPAAAVTLAKARDKARAAREKVAAGIDPIDDRERPTVPVERPTFGAVAIDYMADR
jgi:hypothetical protein